MKEVVYLHVFMKYLLTATLRWPLTDVTCILSKILSKKERSLFLLPRPLYLLNNPQTWSRFL